MCSSQRTKGSSFEVDVIADMCLHMFQLSDEYVATCEELGQRDKAAFHSYTMWRDDNDFHEVIPGRRRHTQKAIAVVACSSLADDMESVKKEYID